MSQFQYLPFADYFQVILSNSDIKIFRQDIYAVRDTMNYQPQFKQIYGQPIFLKGVKKIQSYDNFTDMKPQLISNSSFKKINSVDNFIPEDLDLE